MASDEYQAKEVIAHGVIQRSVELLHARLLMGIGLSTELVLFALEALPPPQEVDCSVLAGCQEPCAWLVRHSRGRPPLQRSDEGVLRELLGQANVAHDSREPGNHSRRLDAPNGFDRSLDLGSRHPPGLQHLQGCDDSGTFPLPPPGLGIS